MANKKYLTERPEWLIYDDEFGGIDYNTMKDDMTKEFVYYYGLTILNPGIQMYFDKPRMRNLLHFFTNEDNLVKMRAELARLDDEHKQVILHRSRGMKKPDIN
jgi:hypothetical protein